MWLDCNSILINSDKLDYVLFEEYDKMASVNLFFSGRLEPLTVEAGNLSYNQLKQLFSNWLINESTTKTDTTT